MSYIVLLLVIGIVPMLVGYRLAKSRPAGFHVHNALAAASAGVAIAVWFGVSWFARRYAETDGMGWAWAERWAHSGKWYFFATFMLFALGFAFGFEKPTARRSRVAVCAVAVLIVIWTTVWRTIPIYAFLPDTTVRDKNGHLTQTAEYTCGPVSLANLMEQFFGFRDVTERRLSRLSRTTCEGTTVSGLVRAARLRGLSVIACRTMSMTELEAMGRPAIVSISTIPSVRHATLLVGFDGDTVRFIDPSYGYREITRARFAQIWYGKTLILSLTESEDQLAARRDGHRRALLTEGQPPRLSGRRLCEADLSRGSRSLAGRRGAYR